MKKFIFLLVSAVLIASCGGSKNGDTTSNDDQNSQYVNVTEQQKPRLIVIPSDQLLQKFGKLKAENAQGKTVYTRDFAGYLLKDPDSKFIIATIQSAFIEFGFPLNDLEQTLKSINDQQMIDEVDNIQMDAKTMLLTTAKPDIILELARECIQSYKPSVDVSNYKRAKDGYHIYTLKLVDKPKQEAQKKLKAAGMKM